MEVRGGCGGGRSRGGGGIVVGVRDGGRGSRMSRGGKEGGGGRGGGGEGRGGGEGGEERGGGKGGIGRKGERGHKRRESYLVQGHRYLYIRYWRVWRMQFRQIHTFR